MFICVQKTATFISLMSSSCLEIFYIIMPVQKVNYVQIVKGKNKCLCTERQERGRQPVNINVFHSKSEPWRSNSDKKQAGN